MFCRLSIIVRVLVLISVLLTFFVRPFALGLDSSLLSNILLLVVSVIVASQVQATMPNRNKIFYMLFSIYILYSIINVVTGTFSITNLYPLLQVISVYLLFKNYEVMCLYFKCLKNTFLTLIVLAVIGFLLECYYGNTNNLLLIKDITYVNRTYEFSLYFPFSWSRMSWYIDGDSFFAGEHMRQYFFFVEPGMAPPFFISCIFILWSDEKEKFKWIQTIVFLLGLFLTFSTGGPLILLVSISVWYFSKNYRKMPVWSIALFVIGLYIAWYAFNYMPIFGRQAKIDLGSSTAGSIEEHENVSSSVFAASILMVLYGILSLKYKFNKSVTMVISAVMALGYMSNYIGYTTLATMFLFWDKLTIEQKMMYGKCIKKVRKKMY